MLSPGKSKNIGIQLAFVLHQEGAAPVTVQIKKSKSLIGSFEHADIRLEGNTVAHYHAMITVQDDGVMHVLDLHSKNGTYINNQMVTSSIVAAGDRITIGGCQLYVEEIHAPSLIDDPDKHLDVMLAPALPPIGAHSDRQGLVLIDGEYCDITFDESKFSPVPAPLLEAVKYDAGSYVDVHEFELKENANLNIVRALEGDSVEVSVCINGVVTTIDYIDLHAGAMNASHNRKDKKTLLIPSVDEPSSFIDIQSGRIDLHPVAGHELYINGKVATSKADVSLPPGQIAFYQRGTVQIFIRFAHRPPKLAHAPFFGRDINFQKQLAKWVSIGSALMLLILLVDTKMEEPEKAVPVIYKRAQREEKAQDAQKNSNVDQQEGQRPDASKDKQLAATKAPQATQNIPTQSPTPAAPAAAAEAKPKPKAMQAYKFEFNNSVASALNTASTTSVDLGQQKSNGKAGMAMDVPSAASGDLLAKTGKVQIGSLGGAGGGSAASGAGAQGLVARNGIDTAYVEPKTVVLGSMDPELLRRILQEHIPQFRHCYQQELAAHSDRVKGVVDLNFRIEKDGSVSHVDIKSKGASFSSSGQGCMSKVLGLITFPKPKGGGVVDVRQPLNFFSEHNKF